MDELAEVVERMRGLTVRLDGLTVRRDDMIRGILNNGGSVAAVTRITGLSRGRVYQIRDRRR